MPLPFIFHTIRNGPPQWVVDYAWRLAYTVTTVAVLVLVKLFSSGRTNKADRPMHGKVVMMTGATTGVGARVADELAGRGAQLVLLTQVAPSDPFLADYIEDLRAKHDNQLIYAEQVDLASLHDIRRFATKWIDNAPPRRLDMIVLGAATLTPPGGQRKTTDEGIEETWMVNYLANFHLLSILSPALRAQPVDRDVRVVIATCSSYIAAPSLKEPFDEANWTPTRAYARSKLALSVFGNAYQKHLDSYKRPDGLPMNSRVVFVDPGLCRTAGMRRWLTRGTLSGLAVYLAFYLVPWILLKSPTMGAQSFLHATMDANLGRGPGGRLVKECREVDFARTEVRDDAVAKKLWEESDALIEKVEKVQAKKRAAAKKAEKAEKAAGSTDDSNDEKSGSAKKSSSSKDKKRDDKDRSSKDKKKDKSRSEKEKAKLSRKKSKKSDA